MIQAVYRVEPNAAGHRYLRVVTEEKGGRYRIAFHGVPVMEHLNGTPSPVTWSQGQGTPVRAVDAAVLFAGEVVPEAVPVDEGLVQREVFGEAVVTSRKGTIVVDVPAGVTVTVRTTAGPTPGEPGARAGLEQAAHQGFGTPQALVRTVVESALAAAGEAIQDLAVPGSEATAGTGTFLEAALSDLRRRMAQNPEAARLYLEFLADPHVLDTVVDRVGRTAL